MEDAISVSATLITSFFALLAVSRSRVRTGGRDVQVTSAREAFPQSTRREVDGDEDGASLMDYEVPEARENQNPWSESILRKIKNLVENSYIPLSESIGELARLAGVSEHADVDVENIKNALASGSLASVSLKPGETITYPPWDTSPPPRKHATKRYRVPRVTVPVSQSGAGLGLDWRGKALVGLCTIGASVALYHGYTAIFDRYAADGVSVDAVQAMRGIYSQLEGHVRVKFANSGGVNVAYFVNKALKLSPKIYVTKRIGSYIHAVFMDLTDFHTRFRGEDVDDNAKVIVTPVNDAIRHLENGGDVTDLPIAVALGKASYHPEEIERDYMLYSYDKDGNIVEFVDGKGWMLGVNIPWLNPVKSKLGGQGRYGPVVLAFQYECNGVPYMCYSIRGTDHFRDVGTDIQLFSILASLMRMTKGDTTNNFHNLVGRDDKLDFSQNTRIVHSGFRSFAMLAVSIIMKDLRDRDISGKVNIQLFGHSLGAASAMIVGHALARARLDEPVSNESVGLPSEERVEAETSLAISSLVKADSYDGFAKDCLDQEVQDMKASMGRDGIPVGPPSDLPTIFEEGGVDESDDTLGTRIVGNKRGYIDYDDDVKDDDRLEPKRLRGQSAGANSDQDHDTDMDEGDEGADSTGQTFSYSEDTSEDVDNIDNVELPYADPEFKPRFDVSVQVISCPNYSKGESVLSLPREKFPANFQAVSYTSPYDRVIMSNTILKTTNRWQTPYPFTDTGITRQVGTCNGPLDVLTSHSAWLDEHGDMHAHQKRADNMCHKRNWRSAPPREKPVSWKAAKAIEKSNVVAQASIENLEISTRRAT